jgi:hypothetical protein
MLTTMNAIRLSVVFFSRSFCRQLPYELFDNTRIGSAVKTP